MTRSEAIRKLAARADTLRAMGIASLAIFGSTAAGEARPDSDLDIIVDPAPGRKFSLFDLVGVKLLIQEELEIEADVTARAGLHPMLREKIERQAVRVF